MPKTYTGRRGMAFEDHLNYTNRIYQNRNIALINKRPTPVKVLKSSGTRVLSGFYENKSTVDYDGVYKGHAITFEAKSFKGNRFDLSNIHQHQYDYLKAAEKHGAITFVLIHWSVTAGDVFFCPFSMIHHYIKAAKDGGRKSIPIDDFAYYAYRVENTKRAALDYLAVVDKLSEG